MKPVGSHNTDPGCWSTFREGCRLIVDMVFDESSFSWGIVNCKAVDAIALNLMQDCIKQSPEPAIRQNPGRQQMRHG